MPLYMKFIIKMQTDFINIIFFNFYKNVNQQEI